MNLVPGVRADISDENVTSASTDAIKVVLLGIKLAAGTGAVNTVTKITSVSQAVEFAGEGSQLVQQVRAFRRLPAPDAFRPAGDRIDLSIVAMAQPAGAAAAGLFTFAGTATTATPILLQIEDVTVSIPVEIGDIATVVAATAAGVLAGPEYASLHVTGTANLADLEIGAKSFGVHGNEISLKVRPLGNSPGLTVTVTPMAGGTGAADVASALASLGNVRWNYIGLGDTDATNLAAVIAHLDDRFTADVAKDGHAVAAKRDTVGNLTTLGLGLDTKQVSIFGDPYLPTNPWVQAAVICAARASEPNPKASIRNTPLSPIVAAEEGLHLEDADQQSLLAAGVSTYWYVQGGARVNRFVTLFKTNSLGQPSDAYRDVETKLTVSEIRQERILRLNPEIGKILVDDVSDTDVGFPVADKVIDAEGIKQILITQHDVDFVGNGWTSDPANFQETLVVTKTGTNQVSWSSQPKINGILYDIPGKIAFTQA